MPLIFDPEYQAELEKYRDRTIRNDRALYWLLLYMLLGFAGVFGALRAAEADASTVISATIVVGWRMPNSSPLHVQMICRLKY